MREAPAVIRGGGDLGSGAALRVWRLGLSVVILETEHPRAVRRTVSFSEAVHDGAARVEEAEARRAHNPGDALDLAAAGVVAVLVDPHLTHLEALNPFALVDAVMAKRNTGTHIDMAPRVVGLGPGFFAGRNCDAVVETNRGPDLGRVLWIGEAEANTGEPGEVAGQRGTRVLRAPEDGTLHAICAIGDLVEAGDVVARVAHHPIRSQLRGTLRGMLRDGARVSAGMKVGDVDPRLDPDLCYRVSDKSLAVAGGVVEALLATRGATVREK